MALRFDDLGNRLRAFRLGSGLSAEEIAKRIGISGNLCRCTGYQNIVIAALDAAKRMKAGGRTP